MSAWDEEYELFEEVPSEVCRAAEEQALARHQEDLRGLAQPIRMLRAIFSFTTERGCLIAEVDAGELAAAASMRPSRARAALDRLDHEGIIYVGVAEGGCCVIVGVPPEGFYWIDPEEAQFDTLEKELFERVLEAKR